METTMQLSPVRQVITQEQVTLSFQSGINDFLTPIEVLESNTVIKPDKSIRKHFIEANTLEVDLNHLQQDCVVPVFSKDNEITISHARFIDSV